MPARKHKIQRYGWIPDLPDHRDLMFAAPPPTVALPPRVDLRPQCPPVYDQGQLGSCTGNSIAGAIQFDRMKQGLADAAFVPSRLFIYYEERVIEHTVAEDAGAQIRDGIKAVAADGVCFESGADAWPYDISKFTNAPPQACDAAAAAHKIQAYHRLNQRTAELRACLAGGAPFVFGFTVYDAFESADVARTGVLNLPGPDEKTVGGHAVMAVGYDDPSERFIIRNSWGGQWGQAGYFTIPYAYLTDDNLSSDFWTITTAG